MGGRSRYRTGRRFEVRVRAALERDGWLVLRAAGSKGPADLVALRRGRRPVLVACSVSGVRPPARRTLVQAARKSGARAVAARRSGRGILMEELR